MKVQRGVSKTRGRGRGGGRVGVGVGFSFLDIFVCCFFLVLTQILISRNLYQLCIVTIFSDIRKIKKARVVKLIFSHHPIGNSCVTMYISVKAVEYRSRKFLF